MSALSLQVRNLSVPAIVASKYSLKRIAQRKQLLVAEVIPEITPDPVDEPGDALNGTPAQIDTPGDQQQEERPRPLLILFGRAWLAAFAHTGGTPWRRSEKLRSLRAA